MTNQTTSDTGRVAFPVRIFMFGYWGWGTTSAQLVESVNAVEQSRGYGSPEWVDVRLNRNVRAKDFCGDAFAETAKRNYRWLRGLGNRLATDPDGEIEIADPSAARNLLDGALEVHKKGRRTIFFCACKYPSPEGRGKPPCHRHVVGELILAEAAKQSVQVEIVEWPGETRRAEPLNLDVCRDVLKTVRSGRSSIPIAEVLNSGRLDLATVAGLPWGTIVNIKFSREEVSRIVGPARTKKVKGRYEWVLPVVGESTTGVGPDLVTLAKTAIQIRHDFGFESRFAPR